MTATLPRRPQTDDDDIGAVGLVVLLVLTVPLSIYRGHHHPRHRAHPAVPTDNGGTETTPEPSA